MTEEFTLQERYDALRRLYEQAVGNIEFLRARRVELEGQVIQNGAECVRLRELLQRVAQETQLADMSADLRHSIEAVIEREEET
jgi:hypothetical protein